MDTDRGKDKDMDRDRDTDWYTDRDTDRDMGLYIFSMGEKNLPTKESVHKNRFQPCL
jgi:hypothetical protein